MTANAAAVGELAPALEARRLSKRYGKTWALRELDLVVDGPGVIGLVGPNAAGKSTLLRTWVGFERPTDGYARIHGLDPRDRDSEASTRVAYVPQAAALYDALTVADHLDLAASILPGFDTSAARDRLAALDIPMSVRARRLSGGQQAQVALALALGKKADVLLLDEPLAHLDPLARRDFLGLVRAHGSEGRTVVLSSHVVTDIEEACDSLAVLSRGEVLLQSTIRNAVESHVIVEPGPTSFQAIGQFSGPNGEPLILARRDRTGPSESLRRANLEEVVLGYLASSRATREAPA